MVDGVIDEPRTCTFSAKANICGAPAAPAANCLDAAEAEAIDRIWDGPRNADGKRDLVRPRPRHQHRAR